VLALARALDPQGLVGLGAFCGATLALLWLALLPMLRARWRHLILDDDRLAAAVPA